MPEELRDALESVVAITVTPFDDETGAVDEPAYRSIAARVAYTQPGIGVVTPNGNTSEFYSLGPAELDRCVELTMEAVSGQALVVPGVGHDVARAVELALGAARAGAAGVMVHQPVHPYQSAAGWVAYHRAVAEAVPELGVVCYVRSPLVTADALVALAEACPNVVGVKYGVPDPLAFATIAARVDAATAGATGTGGRRGRIAWVCGLAEAWAPFFWAGGARGFTSGLVNVAPEVSVELLDRLRDGDREGALRVWGRLRPLEEMRAAAGNADNVSVVKEALAQLGLCGRTVRPPITDLPDPARAQVTENLKHLLDPAT
jgi:4-hydroxy-tetrahydrodipicolinate synthase